MRTCACESSRRSARALTQHYEEALAPSGVGSAQLPILVALARHGPVRLTPLADALGVERTTLTRNLRGLQERSLVEVGSGEDRRTRVAALTSAGVAALRDALARWEQAQAAVEQRFGRERLRTVVGELAALDQAVRT